MVAAVLRPLGIRHSQNPGLVTLATFFDRNSQTTLRNFVA